MKKSATARSAAVLFDRLETRQLFSVPRVEITAPIADVQEGGAAAVLHLRRVGGNIAKPLGVKIAWSGSAKAKDLRGEPDVVTFAARSKTLDIIVTATADGVLEATEAATFRVVAGKKYRATAGVDRATIHVRDQVQDEVPEVGSGTGAGAPTTAGTLNWTQVASAPIGRAEAQSAVVNGKLYAFGGYTNEHWQPIRRVDRYDPATNQWKRMADMPIGLTHAGVAVVGTKVWFAGGYAERVGTIGNQDISINTVLIYDTVKNTWSNGPALPQARGSGGLGLIGNTLYFVAGETRDRIGRRDTWAIDVNNIAGGWKTRASMPQGKSHFATIVVNNQLYTFGGHDGSGRTATIFDTVYRYDPQKNQWTTLRKLPIPMSHIGGATVTRGGKIYMFGGEQQYAEETDQVLEYDPAKNAYRTLTHLPVLRAAAVAGVIGDKFIFSSGLHGTWHDETFIGTFG